jgi:hypothetical protein
VLSLFFTFQDDNAHAHSARAAKHHMSWPAFTPNVNPIEHMRDAIQRRINEVQPRPTTAAKLDASFLKVWICIHMTVNNLLIQ